MKVGDTCTTSKCGDLVVTEYFDSLNVTVKFVATGTVVYNRAKHNILRGSVRDNMIAVICGVGVVGHLPAKVDGIVTKPYSMWRNMITRCYGNNPRWIKYKGCTVADEWLYYPNFHDWYVENFIGGYEIDKDILSGTRYSPETCLMVPHNINILFIAADKSRGKYPVGVSRHARTGSYDANISKYGRSVYIGGYTTPEAAGAAYVVAKELHVKEVAQHEYDSGNIDKQIYDAMIAWKVK